MTQPQLTHEQQLTLLRQPRRHGRLSQAEIMARPIRPPMREPEQQQQQESQVAGVVLPVREVHRGGLDMQYTVDWFATVLRLRLWSSWERADAEMEAAPNVLEETPKKIRRRARRWRRWQLQVKWEKFADGLAKHDEVVRKEARDAARRQEFLHITDYYDTTESD